MTFRNIGAVTVGTTSGAPTAIVAAESGVQLGVKITPSNPGAVERTLNFVFVDYSTGLTSTYPVVLAAKYSNPTPFTFDLEAGDSLAAWSDTAGVSLAVAIVDVVTTPASSGLVPSGAYAAGTTYAKNALVSDAGASWISMVDANIGHTPASSPAYWMLNSAKGAQGDPGTGTGDVVGPAGAVANNLVQFNGTTGKSVKDGGLSIDTDATLAANSDTRLATQKAVKAYADALIAANDAMVFKGVIDASANPNYPAADRGHTYRISVAGKIGGAAGVNVEAGDILIALTDGTAAGTQAAVGAAWTITQANLDGAVLGPTAATDNRIAVFDGTTGKLVKDGGKLIADLLALAGGAMTGALELAAQADLASAATTDLGAQTTNRLRITGTTGITSFGTGANKWRHLLFAGALTLTHNVTSLILPGGANIVTAAGDTAIATSDGAGNWRVLMYQRASGKTVVDLQGVAQTFTATQTFMGAASLVAAIFANAAEVTTLAATAATGTIAIDLATQAFLVYTSNASADWTPNFRFNAGNSLNSVMSAGQTISFAWEVPQGATAYKVAAVQIDGSTSGVDTKWVGGAPTAGNASGVDLYTFAITKTGNATFNVRASVTQFKA